MEETFKVPALPLAKKKKAQAPAEAHTDQATPPEPPPTSSNNDTDKQEPTSPAEPLADKPLSKPVENIPSISYIEPHWSATPTEPYFLSVIKTGTLINEISISDKPFVVFGRLPSCDIQLEHPSLSRYHAVLQYRPPSTEDEQSGETSLSGATKEPGYYIYDLGSTHGTYVNKTEISPRVYVRLRVGQMVKFGGSSRLFLLEASWRVKCKHVYIIVWCVCAEWRGRAKCSGEQCSGRDTRNPATEERGGITQREGGGYERTTSKGEREYGSHVGNG